MSQRELPQSFAWFWCSLVGTAAGASVLLGSWGHATLAASGDDTATGADCLYRGLQLFTLSCDAAGDMPGSLQAARFLAAFTAFSTVAAALVQIFHAQLELVRLRLFSGHTVVAGLGAHGGLLVRALRQAGEAVVVVERDAHHPALSLCRSWGAVVLVGDATDPAQLLRARVPAAGRLLALTEQDGENVEAAIVTQQLRRDAARPYKCVLQIASAELRQVLRRSAALRSGQNPFEVEMFSLYEIAAQALVQAAPPFDSAGPAPTVLLVGLGRLGENLLVRAAKNWLLERNDDNARLRVIIVDRTAPTLGARLQAKYPLLEEVCDLEHHAVDVTTLAFELGSFLPRGPGAPASVAFVCLADETLALVAAARLHALLRPFGIPVIVRMEEDAGLALLLRGPDAEGLRAIGMKNLMCQPELVLETTRELLAPVVHAAYVANERRRGATRHSNPSLLPWAELPEILRESSRQQAAHIPVKLRALGCYVVPTTGEARLLEFRAEEVEALAQLEHERWCAERRHNGWTWGPVKDTARLQHPSLVPWEQLDEDDKDRDREPVRHIPHLLARAGFDILRTSAAPAPAETACDAWSLVGARV